MHFLDNKYTKWYFNIIYKSTDVRIEGKTENHHVLPQCLFPEYKNLRKNPWNGVHLTTREHFLCHWLLTKMVTGAEKHKMAFAFKMLMHMNGNGQDRYKINSHVYAILRENLAKILSDYEFTAERISNMKKAAQMRAENLTDEEREQRRQSMIKLNKQRKGEKRPYQVGKNNVMKRPEVLEKVVGENNHFYNKTHTAETKKYLGSLRKQEVWKCQHCGKEGVGFGNYHRWHNENCKEKENA